MFNMPLCVVCREASPKMKTVYHQLESGGKTSMAICIKCFEETKNNWINNNWKVKKETL